jgi:hypothetical protein
LPASARLTLIRSCALHVLISVTSGLVDAAHADVPVLSHVRAIGPADDLPLGGLVGEAVTNPKFHRGDAGRLGLLLGRDLVNYFCFGGHQPVGVPLVGRFDDDGPAV